MPANPFAVAAGRFRKKITISAPAVARDPFGQPVTTWTTELVTRGDIVEASSREQFAAGHFNAQVTHTITIRYRPNITVAAGMRAISAEGKTYLIQTVNNVEERNRVVKLMCLEQNGVA